ncbi:hypothetical protein GCM10011414_22270 [Croceivirga lutea]|uniref:hypothetical protein n=1 Tax=Croceivirga lutea TaxID=1775167 RepID=UPI00163A6E45|nr:hypothetical protein [Croceivirga lutea]GGG52254.1 hypothetical protein GCM10011414_22270 [Croceivirga lutea]
MLNNSTNLNEKTGLHIVSNAQQTPLFFTNYQKEFTSTEKQAYPWHFSITIGTGGSLSEIKALKEELEIQALIEEFLTQNISDFSSIKKICGVFNTQGKIEYHWYLKEPILKINFEEIQALREISFSLQKDYGWQNISTLLQHITKTEVEKNNEDSEIRELILNASN